MGSQYRVSIRDNTKELGKSEFNTVPLTAANLAAQTTLADALRDAINGVILGTEASTAFTIATILSNAVPANVLAQRGVKWVLQGEDATTHELFQNYVPTADLSLLVSGQEELDLTANPGLALKTAYEAFVKSPGDHAAVLIRVFYSD